MIIKPDFRKKGKIRRAAALLALGADDDGQQGRCLTAGEMALLVEGGCSEIERKHFMQHLSGCEQCYGEWLTLISRETVPPGTPDQMPKPGYRWKLYGGIGSALAVAASVVIFFNIYKQPQLTVRDLRVPAASSPLPQKPAVPQGKREEDARPKAKSFSPGAGNSQKRESGLSALRSQPAPPAAEKTIRTENDAISADRQAMDSWLAAVRRNCLAGSQGADFWAKMVVQGQSILTASPADMSGQEREKISAVLAALKQMTERPIPGQCRQILKLLAEQPETR